MLIIPPAAKAYVKIEPVDFRMGIDKLVALTSQKMQMDARSGAAFVFCNNKKTSIKVLYFDRQGYWLCQKRFSDGRMRNWPKEMDSQTLILNLQELVVLLSDGDLSRMNFKKVFHSGENVAC